MALRFTFNPYVVQFMLRRGELVLGRWRMIWGQRAATSGQWF
jgi:hypothetical protein